MLSSGLDGYSLRLARTQMARKEYRMYLKHLPSALALVFCVAQPASAADTQRLMENAAHALSVTQAAIDSRLISIAKKLDNLDSLKISDFRSISGGNDQLQAVYKAIATENFDNQRRQLVALQKSLDTSKFAKGIGVLGKGADTLSVLQSSKVILVEADSLEESVQELSNVAGIAIGYLEKMKNISQAGGALIPIEGTKILVNRSLDSARDISEQISEIIIKDRDSFHNQRRTVIHNTILANLGKPQFEVQALAFEAVKALAAEYANLYSEGGDMYKFAYGDGGFFSGVAVRLEYASTLGMVQKGFNENQNYFSKFETLGSDARVLVTDEFEKKFTALNQLTEMNNLLTSLHKDFAALQSDADKFAAMLSADYDYLRVKESTVLPTPKSLATTQDFANKQPQHRELNVDAKLRVVENATSGNPDSLDQPYSWNGNFVLNYGFGYGDGEFTTTNTKPAPGGDATLTYYHLGKRHYQVEIGDIELDELGNYNYTVWGDWRKADSKLAQFEADYAHCSSCTSELTPWVAVQRMRPDDIQRLSGSATYRGELSSVMIGESGGSAFQQGSGSILMTANFGNDHLSGTLIVRRQSDVWATATFATELERDAGLQFDSTLSGTNISNAQNWHSQIRGEFGGPQANEAGGMWAITKTDGSQATGTFHAKKQ